MKVTRLLELKKKIISFVSVLLAGLCFCVNVYAFSHEEFINLKVKFNKINSLTLNELKIYRNKVLKLYNEALLLKINENVQYYTNHCLLWLNGCDCIISKMERNWNKVAINLNYKLKYDLSNGYDTQKDLIDIYCCNIMCMKSRAFNRNDIMASKDYKELIKKLCVIKCYSEMDYIKINWPEVYDIIIGSLIDFRMSEKDIKKFIEDYSIYGCLDYKLSLDELIIYRYKLEELNEKVHLLSCYGIGNFFARMCRIKLLQCNAMINLKQRNWKQAKCYYQDNLDYKSKIYDSLCLYEEVFVKCCDIMDKIDSGVSNSDILVSNDYRCLKKKINKFIKLMKSNYVLEIIKIQWPEIYDIMEIQAMKLIEIIDTQRHCCTICLKRLEDDELVFKSDSCDCDTYYHKDCLKKYLKKHKKCPLCGRLVNNVVFLDKSNT